MVGFIGVPADHVAASGISMYGDSAWSILQDVAITLANVSNVLTAEGLMIDVSLPDYAVREVCVYVHMCAYVCVCALCVCVIVFRVFRVCVYVCVCVCV